MDTRSPFRIWKCNNFGVFFTSRAALWEKNLKRDHWSKHYSSSPSPKKWQHEKLALQLLKRVATGLNCDFSETWNPELRKFCWHLPVVSVDIYVRMKTQQMSGIFCPLFLLETCINFSRLEVIGLAMTVLCWETWTCLPSSRKRIMQHRKERKWQNSSAWCCNLKLRTGIQCSSAFFVTRRISVGVLILFREKYSEMMKQPRK